MGITAAHYQATTVFAVAFSCSSGCCIREVHFGVRVHTCVVVENSAIDVQAAVIAQQLNCTTLEAIVVGEIAVCHGNCGCVCKYGSSCCLGVAHKSDILKCDVAVLENDGPLTVLHKVGEQGVLNVCADAIQIHDTLRKGIVKVVIHTYMAAHGTVR